MSIRLQFLDWSKNPLIRTADALIAQAEGNWLDLSSTLLVLPGRHAANRLLEVLVQKSEKESVVLTPPVLLTAGDLPEYLYSPSRRFATSLEQLFAWRVAFEELDRNEVQAVFPKPPGEEEFSKWMGLIQTVDALHRDLASQMCSFRDASRAAKELKLEAEIGRWELLWNLQRKFWKVLEKNELWDKQTARRLAVENNEIACDKKIVMVGTIDLPEVVRRMVLQIPGEVTSYVFCESSQKSLFDEVGCIKIADWFARSISIPDQNLTIATKPEDQAEVVIGQIRRAASNYSANQIVVGLPDDRLAPVLENRFENVGVRCRNVKGKPIRQTSFLRLLTAIGDFVATGEYSQFSSLIRHPVFSKFIDLRMGERTWVKSLDRWFENRLPYDLLDQSVVASGTAAKVLDIVKLGLEPITSGGRRSISEWPERFQKIFESLFAEKKVDRENREDQEWITAFKKMSEVFKELAEIHPSLSRKVRVDEFLDLVFRQLQSGFISEEPSPEKIELIGWLDFPMDDAPVGILTSFNEGFIPSSDAAHPFLNQAMRSRLGLLDNRRRYARDAYALELVLHSKDIVHLIVGKTNAEDDPLKPSRLALALEGEALARRAKLLFEEKTDSKETLRKNVPPSREIEIPRPAPLAEPVIELAVTDFKNYLACPYRFYLKKFRKAQSWDDLAEELQGNQFGSLLHNVLEDFAGESVKDSKDPEEIGKFLCVSLHGRARIQFGAKMRPAIHIQLKQAELRLEKFAQIQAIRRMNGWKIIDIEWEGEAEFLVNGSKVKVVGRIDRIDQHEESGQFAVWDYKTSDSLKSLESLYFAKDEDGVPQWVDLQLPLYSHMLRSKKGSKAKSAILGIISLPKKLGDVRFLESKWRTDQLEKADQKIHETIENILEENFWPPAEKNGFDPGIERICQTGVLKMDLQNEP